MELVLDTKFIHDTIRSHMVANGACCRYGDQGAESSADMIAGDVVNMLLAGPAPSDRHLLCACNRSWVEGEDGTHTTDDGVTHVYDGCCDVVVGDPRE